MSAGQPAGNDSRLRPLQDVALTTARHLFEIAELRPADGPMLQLPTGTRRVSRSTDAEGGRRGGGGVRRTQDAHSLRKRVGLVPAGGMNGRVPDDLPACETCVDVVYIDRQGEERSETMHAELARDFTDRKGLKECRECAKLCLPVLYEDYEGGHTDHTCYLCDFEWMVRDAMQVDPTGKSRAELAAEYARRQDSYYRAAGPVGAVRKVWS